jgi:hypothetical protein
MTGPTISANRTTPQERAMHQLYDATQDSTPLPRWVAKQDADRKASLAFFRGITLGCLIGAGIAFSLPAVVQIIAGWA